MRKNIEKTFSKVLEIKNKSLSLHPLSGNNYWEAEYKKRSLGYLHIRFKEDKAEYTRDLGASSRRDQIGTRSIKTGTISISRGQRQTCFAMTRRGIVSGRKKRDKS